MPVRWDESQFTLALDEFRGAYLHAAGELITDQAAENWNVKTGRGRNSVHYVITGGQRSEFGTATGEGGDSTPPASAKLDAPNEAATVRIGSGLVYAGPHEKKTAWLSKAIDVAQSRLGDLARAVAGRSFR